MSYVEAQAMMARYQSVGATLASLGGEAAQSGPSSFAATLAQVGAELDGSPQTAGAPQTVAAPAATSAPYLSTSSLLGLSGQSSAPGMVSADALGGTAGWAAGSAATAGAGSVGLAGTADSGSAVVADAARYIGVPYVWGGTSPSGFDCSGLVQYVYRQLGVALPRTSEQQATAGTPVAGLAAARPGDLVFFAGSDGTEASPGHVGIYIGNGQMIDAPHTGTTVQVQPVGTPSAIRRVLPDPAGFAAAGGSGWASGTDGAASPAGAVPASLGAPADLTNLFTTIGQSTGVSPALLAAVAKQESGFRSDAVSGAGAEGLMQLMPSMAAGLGVDPLDPAQAITGAATLLKGYLGRFGSVPLALAAYNAGPGAVSSYGGVPPFGETQRYVADITGMLGLEAA